MSRFYLPERGIGRIVGVLLYAACGVGLYFFAMWLKPRADAFGSGFGMSLRDIFGGFSGNIIAISLIVVFCGALLWIGTSRK